jgi:homoserine acetyltransferase
MSMLQESSTKSSGFFNQFDTAALEARIDDRITASLDSGMTPANWAGQLQAVLDFDLAASSGGDMAVAAAKIEADLLVFVNTSDQRLLPEPVKDLAEMVANDGVGGTATVLEYTHPCGHTHYFCVSQTAATVKTDLYDTPVKNFLSTL